MESSSTCWRSSRRSTAAHQASRPLSPSRPREPPSAEAPVAAMPSAGTREEETPGVEALLPGAAAPARSTAILWSSGAPTPEARTQWEPMPEGETPGAAMPQGARPEGETRPAAAQRALPADLHWFPRASSAKVGTGFVWKDAQSQYLEAPDVGPGSRPGLQGRSDIRIPIAGRREKAKTPTIFKDPPRTERRILRNV